MSNKVDGWKRVLRVLPGTTRDLCRRTGYSPTKVRRVIRCGITLGVVRRGTRWSGNNSYTFVYSLARPIVEDADNG
jgi:hypothetical protein